MMKSEEIPFKKIRDVNLPISVLIYNYKKLPKKEFKEKFEIFIKRYYYYALDQIKKTNNIEKVRACERIINTYSVFTALLEDNHN